MGILVSCSDNIKHRVWIWKKNDTEKVLIKNFFINGKEINAIKGHELVVQPEKYNPDKDYVKFSQGKNINIKAEFFVSQKTVHAQCVLDVSNKTCFVNVTFTGSGNLNCKCDEVLDETGGWIDPSV